MKKLLVAMIAVGFVIGCGGDTSAAPKKDTATPAKADTAKK
jgi:hypothetical protein